MKLLRVGVLLLACTGVGSAWGHALQVFVTVSGTELMGNAYFTGGGPARAVPVFLEATPAESDEKEILWEGETSMEGSFQFDLQTIARDPETTLVVAAESVDGHRATWQLRADDLAGIPNPRVMAPREIGWVQAVAGVAGIALMSGLMGLVVRRKRDV